MKSTFQQPKKSRCPACFRMSLERDQSDRVCSACGYRGSFVDVQERWDALQRLAVTTDQQQPAAPEQPAAAPAPNEQRDFRVKVGETPRDRAIAMRNMLEVLKKMGARVPISMIQSDNARPETDAEINARMGRVASEKEQEHDKLYQQIRTRIGLGPTGAVVKRS